MKHFTIVELTRSTTAQKHNINNVPTSDVTEKLEALVGAILDPVREMLGKPIRVNSGFRSFDLNRKVGGAASSQHVKGEAVDITTGTKDGNRQLFELIRDNFEYDQLINEHDFSWIHVSYRSESNRMQTLKIG